VINLAVLGATGRMGQAILRCLAESKDFRLSGAVTRIGDPALGRDAGEFAGLAPFGVPLTDDPAQALHRARVAIDFTLPVALEANLRACREAGTPVVVGTTGLAAQQETLLEQASREIPVVYGRNMSIAMNVFIHFVGRSAAALGEDYDVEIVEAHHRNKVDAPSGTAIELGEVVAAARKRKLSEVAVMGREGQVGPRVPGTIGFSSIRGGNIVGDHSVMFIAPDERVEFTHRAADRRAFALGALRAASWVAGRAPGLYSMADVLDLA
jgi:4-hydroxy-tetrahydrodipicolinate reductase